MAGLIIRRGIVFVSTTLASLISIAGCPNQEPDPVDDAQTSAPAPTSLAQAPAPLPAPAPAPAPEPAPAPAPPPPPEPTTLLDVTISALSPFGFPGFQIQTFAPVSANKPVTVQLAGNLTGSRVTIAVFDSAGNLVAAEDLPLTNRSTLLFAPTTTGEHFILLQELAEISTVYEITVTQQL